MDADHRKPLDDASFLVSQAILLVVSIPALVPKPAKVIAFVVVGWHFYRTIFTQTTGNFNSDFVFGSGVLFEYIAILDFALLTPPENLKDFHDNDPTRVTKRSLKKRVLWALKLFPNPRGIGWAHEPLHIPLRPSPLTPRSTFVISRILHATSCFLLVGGTYLFDTSYAGVTRADKLLIGAPLHRRVVGVLSFGLSSLGMISGVNAAFAASAVGCGFSSPERWPLQFGSPLQVWSIKRFWRIFWHQMTRKCVLTCTSSLLGCVFPAKYVGTPIYKFARLYTAFCISGLAHMGGDVMATGKLCFKSFTFFMLQPIGITIELIVSYLWHRLQSDVPNPKKTIETEGCKNTGQATEEQHNDKSLAEDSIPPLWIRCVGSIWVALWMLWTAAYMADALNFARLSANPGQNLVASLPVGILKSSDDELQFVSGTVKQLSVSYS